MMIRELPRRVGVVLALLVVGGCSVSVYVRSAAETRYLQTWKRDWEPIIAHSQPLRPTGSSPGVCNAGGSQRLCHDTSGVVLGDYQKLGQDLRGAWIPVSLRSANGQVQQALGQVIQGLGLRISAIENNDDAAWQQANDVLRMAEAAMVRAYEGYPANLKPLPPPYL